MARKGPAGNSVSIRLSVADKAALDKLADRYGLKQYTAAGEVLSWLIRQPEIVQLAVLGLVPHNTDHAMIMRALVFPEVVNAAMKPVERLAKKALREALLRNEPVPRQKTAGRS